MLGIASGEDNDQEVVAEREEEKGGVGDAEEERPEEARTEEPSENVTQRDVHSCRAPPRNPASPSQRSESRLPFVALTGTAHP